MPSFTTDQKSNFLLISSTIIIILVFIVLMYIITKKSDTTTQSAVACPDPVCNSTCPDPTCNTTCPDPICNSTCPSCEVKDTNNYLNISNLPLITEINASLSSLFGTGSNPTTTTTRYDLTDSFGLIVVNPITDYIISLNTSPNNISLTTNKNLSFVFSINTDLSLPPLEGVVIARFISNYSFDSVDIITKMNTNISEIRTQSLLLPQNRIYKEYLVYIKSNYLPELLELRLNTKNITTNTNINIVSAKLNYLEVDPLVEDRNYIKFQDKNINGGVIEAPGNIKNDTDCMDLCNQNPFCVNYTWYPNEVCYLRSRINNISMTDYSGAVTGISSKLLPPQELQEVLPEEILPEEILSEEVISEEVLPEEVLSEEVTSPFTEMPSINATFEIENKIPFLRR